MVGPAKGVERMESEKQLVQRILDNPSFLKIGTSCVLREVRLGVQSFAWGKKDPLPRLLSSRPRRQKESD